MLFRSECYGKETYGDAVLDGDLEGAGALPFSTGRLAVAAFLALELKDRIKYNKFSN